MTQEAICFDDFDLPQVAEEAADFGQGQFGCVVTPNADHLIRLKDDSRLREAYARATYVLLDSRFIALLLRAIRGLRMPVCTGSDLTAKLFRDIIKPSDKLVLIGTTAEQAQTLRERYGLQNLQHYNPPMGFISREDEVLRTLEFIEQSSPFRFCLLAVGSPQQEIVAGRLRERGIAKGLALCIGASINFITGHERRAPGWMQSVGLEWAYRLLQDPRRLAHRYLVRGPRVFPLVRSLNFVLRKRGRGAGEGRLAGHDAPVSMSGAEAMMMNSSMPAHQAARQAAPMAKRIC